MTRLERGQTVEYNGDEVMILNFIEVITAVEDGEPQKNIVVKYTTETEHGVYSEHQEGRASWDDFIEELEEARR